MAVIQSRIDPSSETFQANRRDMLALVEQFRALEQRVRETSNAKLPMFQKRGQLTPRQRIAHLIDRGSPFLEISTLAGLNMHDDDGAENIQGGIFERSAHWFAMEQPDELATRLLTFFATR